MTLCPMPSPEHQQEISPPYLCVLPKWTINKASHPHQGRVEGTAERLRISGPVSRGCGKWESCHQLKYLIQHNEGSHRPCFHTPIQDHIPTLHTCQLQDATSGVFPPRPPSLVILEGTKPTGHCNTWSTGQSSARMSNMSRTKCVNYTNLKTEYSSKLCSIAPGKCLGGI